ncbi:MAG: SMP-30/gluconolactonase/LRE family protein [Planctomycetes bacterium]|nr:SMP-30/gluconolactonase/LRE family protein [Planctomycetota bacterium]
MSREPLRELTDPTLVSVCVAGDAWPRGLLSENPIPDNWMGLVIKPDSRRRYVPAGENPRAERGDKLVLTRNRPITVPLNVSNCQASQGNLVDATCELLVRWQAREDDLAALERSLLSELLTLQRLASVVADAGGLVALRQFIRERSAEKLVREDMRDELLSALREQLRKFAFETGMELDRIARLEFVSESFERQAALKRDTRRRVERIRAAKLVDAAALAATKRRLGDLGDILERLKSAAAGEEKTQWHQLLPALSPADRGRLLENLWRLTPDRHVAAAIVVVTGSECLWLDPANPERIARRVTLSSELGGLRAVTFSREKDWLLVGAASGVWALDADTGELAARFVVPDIEPPRTGFNAAVVAGDRLYATSSELGCWSWSLDDPADAKPILVPEGGVPKRIRTVVATDDGRVLFAADDCIHVYQPQADELEVLSAGTDVIHCLAALEDKLFVGTGDGKLYRVDLNHPDHWWLVQQMTTTIESVQPRRWTDLIELVVPAGPRGISGIYDVEGVVTCLLESATPIRRAWACDDVVVGLNQLRDRLVVMNANLPERVGRDVRIGQMTGQSVQDACIVIRRGAGV